MKLKDCINERLIRKDSKGSERVLKSLEIASRFMKSSIKNLEIREYEMAFIAAYNSIFHSSRALLFNKGFVERSHFCLYVALRSLYEDHKLIEFLNAIDKVRVSRHEIQYQGYVVDKEEVEFVVNLAKEFLNYVKKLL